MKLLIMMFLLGWYGIECLPSGSLQSRIPCRSTADCPRSMLCMNSFCHPLCKCPVGRICRFTGKRAVCECPNNYKDQNGRCVPTLTTECSENSVCRNDQSCNGVICIDPCDGACGTGADCKVTDHKPICSCPIGFTGHPFEVCRPLSSLCDPSPCGENTNCMEKNKRAVCSCLPGHVGDPLTKCTPECDSDIDCPTYKKCKSDSCQDACYEGACGDNALCKAENHMPSCTCPTGYSGDPYDKCIGCLSNSRCPEDQACIKTQCRDACYSGVCGVNAECKVKNHNPTCSCPLGYQGDPFVSCRPIECRNHPDCPSDKYCLEKKCVDPCSQNTCGTDASCRTINNKQTCFCPPGYGGNPSIACRKKCDSQTDCPANSVCTDGFCEVDICSQYCGTDATCKTKNNMPVCSCPSGYGGNPLVACNKRCADNIECPSDKMCLEGVCVDPCSQNLCPTDTICHTNNQRPVCECRSGYEGNPLVKCTKTCVDNSECPSDRHIMLCSSYSLLKQAYSLVGMQKTRR